MGRSPERPDVTRRGRTVQTTIHELFRAETEDRLKLGYGEVTATIETKSRDSEQFLAVVLRISPEAH